MKKCLYVSVPRSVVGTGPTKVILHGFADASKLAISIAVYALAIHTSAPVQQNLLGKVKDSTKGTVHSSLGTCCRTHPEQIDASCEGSLERSTR